MRVCTSAHLLAAVNSFWYSLVSAGSTARSGSRIAAHSACHETA